MEFDWGYFFSLFSVGAFWQACVTVVVVSSLSWFIGLILGFLLACAKLSGPRWLKVPVELYIWSLSITCRSCFRPPNRCSAFRLLPGWYR